jgi:hypothetical protein
MSSSHVLPADAAAERQRAKKKAQVRAGWLRQIVRWHWISAAICLIGMLLFAITGITLNHAGAIKAEPRTVERTAELPASQRVLLKAAEAKKGPLPAETRAWLDKSLSLSVPADAAVEWSPDEAYVALPRPGGDGWVSLNAATGEVVTERTDRGWVSYLNDLHKGRNTGLVWRWFLDIFSIGAIVFCVTGLILMQLHAHARPSTWPLLGLGLIIPFLLALIFIH